MILKVVQAARSICASQSDYGGGMAPTLLQRVSCRTSTLLGGALTWQSAHRQHCSPIQETANFHRRSRSSQRDVLAIPRTVEARHDHLVMTPCPGYPLSKHLWVLRTPRRAPDDHGASRSRYSKRSLLLVRPHVTINRFATRVRKAVSENTPISVRLTQPDAPSRCADRGFNAAAVARECTRDRPEPHPIANPDLRIDSTTRRLLGSNPQDRLGESCQVRKARRGPRPVHRDHEGLGGARRQEP